MKIRIIHCATDNLMYQDIIFTEDFKSPVSYFTTPKTKVIIDEICDCELPDFFPTETTFKTGVLKKYV